MSLAVFCMLFVPATPPIVAGARGAHPWGPLLILSA